VPPHEAKPKPPPRDGLSRNEALRSTFCARRTRDRSSFLDRTFMSYAFRNRCVCRVKQGQKSGFERRVQIRSDDRATLCRSGDLAQALTVSAYLVRNQNRVLQATHVDWYMTGPGIGHCHEPKVRRAPWSGMRPTFVSGSQLGCSNLKLGAQGVVFRFVPVPDALCFHGQNANPITGITRRPPNAVFSAL
jgi:hypothetical protein